MAFGLEFNKTFREGLGIGASNYQQDQKRRINIEEETQKRIAEVNKKNKETEAYAKMFGLTIDKDPTTGEMKTKAPEGWTFKAPAPSLQAELFPEMGNEYQQSFISMMSQVKEQSKPKVYTNYKEVYDPKTKQGLVTAIDPETKNRVEVGVNPYYTPQKLQSDVIEGEIELEDGIKVGSKGRRTRLMTYEDKTYKTIDLGRIKTGDSNSKTPTQFEFELEMAELNEKVTETQQKRQTYLTKKFANNDERNQFKDGINSELNRLALTYGKLASPDAQKKILEIFAQGKKDIGGGKVDRKKFYNQKQYEIEQEYIVNGDNDGQMYRDGTIISQFLKAKYDLWIPYEDSQADKNEINFDELNLNLE